MREWEETGKLPGCCWILMPQTEEGSCGGGNDFGIGHNEFEENCCICVVLKVREEIKAKDLD